MATFKAVVRAKQTNRQGLTNVKIRVTQNGICDDIPTKHYIKPGHIKTSGIVLKDPNSDYINNQISITIVEYQNKLLKAGKKAERWDGKQIKHYLMSENLIEMDYFEYARKRIAYLKENNKATWVTYNQGIDQFEKFVGVNYLPFPEITKSLLEKFADKYTNKNTAGNYLRSVRAIFYDAMDEFNKDDFDPMIKSNPFRKFSIPQQKPKKRNLELDVLFRLMEYENPDRLKMIAKKTALLIFYLIGINMKDLFYSRGLKDGRIVYSRFKTHKEYSIKVEPEAAAILEEFKGVKYLIKFADNCQEERTEVRSPHTRFLFQYKDHIAFLHMVNKKLKEICKDMKIPVKLSTYYMRHTWSTIARNNLGISKDDIGLCLGHSDPDKKVTSGYINDDPAIIDRTNKVVIDFVMKTFELYKEEKKRKSQDINENSL